MAAVKSFIVGYLIFGFFAIAQASNDGQKKEERGPKIITVTTITGLKMNVLGLKMNVLCDAVNVGCWADEPWEEEFNQAQKFEEERITGPVALISPVPKSITLEPSNIQVRKPALGKDMCRILAWLKNNRYPQSFNDDLIYKNYAGDDVLLFSQEEPLKRSCVNKVITRFTDDTKLTLTIIDGGWQCAYEEIGALSN